MAKKTLRVALVHDYLREYGGAERVLEALHAMYPEAPVYVAFTDPKVAGKHWQRFDTWDIRTTWMARIPFIKKLFSPLRFLAPHAFSALDLSEYDLVISSSNAYYAKAVKVPNGTHICYCHTPPRALYGYSTMTNWKANPVLKFFGTLLNHYLRVVDVKIAQAVDVFIANSQETQRRIEKFYRRESQVVYPPVSLADNPPKPLSFADREYYLYVSRLSFAKHPEIAIAVCSERSLPLKVVGDGSLLSELRDMAGSTVSVVGAVSDSELQKLYAKAKALLYPVEDEDFGIVPVEAMAFGVPVIAHNSGGPQETVVPGVTGVLFDDLSKNGLAEALQNAEKTTFSATKIQAFAKKFSTAEFSKKITKIIDDVM